MATTNAKENSLHPISSARFVTFKKFRELTGLSRMHVIRMAEKGHITLTKHAQKLTVIDMTEYERYCAMFLQKPESVKSK